MALENCNNCNEPVYSGTLKCPHCKTLLGLTPNQSPNSAGGLSKAKPVDANSLESNVAYLNPEVKPLHHLSTKQLGVMVEFRRTCQVCGKVWHSLVSREQSIVSKQKANSLMACGGAMQGCSSCGTIGGGTQAQAIRNVDANQTELQRLRSCPECSSSNYREEVIDHANS